jgi:hypothetical protein
MRLKDCCACEKPSVIWKNDRGDLYCKSCWSRKNPKTITKKSEKQVVAEKSYSLIRKAFLIKHTKCQAGLPGCSISSTEVHHKKGRIGSLLIDTNFFLAVCRNCHDYIENNPSEAKELGLSESRLKT